MTTTSVRPSRSCAKCQRDLNGWPKYRVGAETLCEACWREQLGPEEPSPYNFWLLTIGALLLCVGLYFQLDPGVPTGLSAAERNLLREYDVSMPESVVNLQRLAWGVTSSIVGAMFLLAGLHPPQRQARNRGTTSPQEG